MEGSIPSGPRDAASCTRLGLGARKIWAGFRGLLLAWLTWDVFVYLGFLAAGADMAAQWSASRLLPLPSGLFWSGAVPVALLVVGVLLVIYVLMRTSLAISWMTFRQLGGDNFYSGPGAAAFVRAHSAPLLAVPLLLVMALLVAFGVALVAGLISRIPAVGPVLVALGAVPMWGMMLLATLTIVALLVGIRLVPVVVACTGGDTFEAVFELFSTLTSRTWLMFRYLVVACLTVLLGGLVFLLFSSAAMALLAWAVGLGAGDAGLGAAMAAGPRLLAPEVLPYFSRVISVPGVPEGAAWGGAAGVIAGLSGTAVLLVLLSFLLSSSTSAWTVTYLGLRRSRDGVDLLERAAREEERRLEAVRLEAEERAGAEGSD